MAYSLSMQISLVPLVIFKIAVGSSFVHSIQLALITIQVRLPQRPRLRQRQLLQRISNAAEVFVSCFESFIYLALPGNRQSQ